MKIIYWIIGIVFAIVIFFAGYQFWQRGQSSTINTRNNSNSSATSGTGNNNHNPAQEILKHIKQGQLPLTGNH